MTYIPRDIAFQVLSAVADMPVVAITGMRQTGKSTFLQEQAELQGRKYITLDDFAQLAVAKENPDRFVDTEEQLAIDKAQRCLELFRQAISKSPFSELPLELATPAVNSSFGYYSEAKFLSMSR